VGVPSHVCSKNEFGVACYRPWFAINSPQLNWLLPVGSVRPWLTTTSCCFRVDTIDFCKPHRPVYSWCPPLTFFPPSSGANMCISLRCQNVPDPNSMCLQNCAALHIHNLAGRPAAKGWALAYKKPAGLFLRRVPVSFALGFFGRRRQPEPNAWGDGGSC
jgi:hypothetical protein